MELTFKCSWWFQSDVKLWASITSCFVCVCLWVMCVCCVSVVHMCCVWVLCVSECCVLYVWVSVMCVWMLCVQMSLCTLFWKLITEYKAENKFFQIKNSENFCAHLLYSNSNVFWHTVFFWQVHRYIAKIPLIKLVHVCVCHTYVIRAKSFVNLTSRFKPNVMLQLSFVKSLETDSNSSA